MRTKKAFYTDIGHGMRDVYVAGQALRCLAMPRRRALLEVHYQFPRAQSMNCVCGAVLSCLVVQQRVNTLVLSEAKR